MAAERIASPIEISVVCPVTRDSRALSTVHREFADVLASTGRAVEFVYVVDGPHTGAEAELDAIRETRFPVRICRLARAFGEATALRHGFDQARGRLCLTIADRPQVDAAVALEILERLDGGASFVVTRRLRSDSVFNRLQSAVFHALVRRLVWEEFHDMTCGVRGMTREAARKLDLYGDQHRFVPVLAVRHGYRPIELEAEQHPADRALKLYRPGVYVRRLLDVFNIFFLIRFTRKPLRFFGLIGAAVGGVGFAICAALAVQRLLGQSALADRPLLLLGVLLLVLGVQVVSIGLLGEIIIFLSARRERPEVLELTSDADRQTDV